MPPLVGRLLAQLPCPSPAPLGEWIANLPLHGERARPTPFGRLVGGPGLDARQFTDLATLGPDRLVTPIDEMFIRTAAPPALRQPPSAWSVAWYTGGDTPASAIPRLLLQADARPMGAHLIECAGNADPDNFGLMSVIEWDGVPLTRLVAQQPVPRGGWGLLVNGFDEHAGPGRSSNAGASWILPLDTLDRLGAFLAVRMNGQPLTPDHGAPVRLVVPGWYGCSWIKWVTDIRVVDRDAASTTQMLEFARRTHQDGLPALARDYEPPVIDAAATPIRVEKRRLDGRVFYRIVGIVWGGERPVEKLAIRFRAGEPPRPFPVCPPPATHRTWSLWEYRWTPPGPGTYDIALSVPDSTVRTRRLDLSYYVRRVTVDS